MNGPPNSWYYDEDKDDDTRHNSISWRDDSDPNIIHRESYDYDSQGNVTNYHYGQTDQSDKSETIYNYHTDQWEDKT